MTNKLSNQSSTPQKNLFLKSTLGVVAWMAILNQTFRAMPRKKHTSQIISSMTFLALLFLSAGCVSAQSTEELLQNPGFEGTYPQKARSWIDNTYGNPRPTVTYKRETANVRSGSSAQTLQISSLSGGKVQFGQKYNFIKNHTYEASIWLRSSSSMPVQVVLRQANAPYTVYMSKSVQVDRTWRQVKVAGTLSSDVTGIFNIIPQQTGTLWLDDASLKDITSANSNSVALQGKIPSNYFGLHINCLGCVQGTWPGVNFGMLRLWDMGGRWQQIEPRNNDWQWSTLDYYVAKANNRGVEMLYTLGQSPKWASARPNESATNGNGAAAEPANISDWRDYVRTVATRYKGKIKYYEIWNEANYKGFYTGSVDKMIELTRVASEELKAVDPNIVVISPNVGSMGTSWMDGFLTKGGGAYVDVIGWHYYFSLKPEEAMPAVKNSIELLKSHNISKPLYATEGAGRTSSATTRPTDDQSRATIARTYILFWAHGVSNFNWHMWDLLGTHNVWLVQDDKKGLRPAGVAYGEIANWLKGAQMTSKSVDSNNTWVIEIKRDNGYVGQIIWNPDKQLNWSISANSGIVRRRDLKGASKTMSGVSSAQIGPVPILLENQAI